jgi:hypothetical protein
MKLFSKILKKIFSILFLFTINLFLINYFQFSLSLFSIIFLFFHVKNIFIEIISFFKKKKKLLILKFPFLI